VVGVFVESRSEGSEGSRLVDVRYFVGFVS
jgi:hypothetical protein